MTDIEALIAHIEADTGYRLVSDDTNIGRNDGFTYGALRALLSHIRALSGAVEAEPVCEQCGFPASYCNEVTKLRQAYEDGLRDGGMAGLAARLKANVVYPALIRGDTRLRPIRSSVKEE